MYNKGQRTSTDEKIRLIESMFYNEQSIKKAVYEAHMQQTAKGHTGGGNGHTYISDPTALEAIKNISPIKYVYITDSKGHEVQIQQPEKWIKVINATYRQGSDTQREALKMRYRGIQRDIICGKLSITRATYHYLINLSHQFAIAAACQERLMEVI